MLNQVEHFIDGTRVIPGNGVRCKDMNPATGEVLAEVVLDEVSARIRKFLMMILLFQMQNVRPLSPEVGGRSILEKIWFYPTTIVRVQ